jgi:hypothetical protein
VNLIASRPHHFPLPCGHYKVRVSPGDPPRRRHCPICKTWTTVTVAPSELPYGGHRVEFTTDPTT